MATSVAEPGLRRLLQQGQTSTPFNSSGQIRRYFDLDAKPPRYCIEVYCWTTTMDDDESRGHIELNYEIINKIIDDLLDSGRATVRLENCNAQWEGRERFFESPSWRDYTAEAVWKEAILEISLEGPGIKISDTIHGG